MLLTLFAVLAMSIYLYGIRVLIMTAVTVLAALLFDYACMRLLGKPKGERVDAHTVITGLIFTLCLSAITPYWVALYGMVFAIVVAKFPFGGNGKNIFNPAAVGLAFCAISFPGYLFQYPAPYTHISLIDPLSTPLVSSPGFVLQAGGNPNINYMNTLLINYSGPIGATALLVIGACALYLMIRKTIKWRVVFSAVIAFSLLAFLFPRTSADSLHSVAYELVSGIFAFAVVFMASDPVTSPRTSRGQVLYGVFIGLGTMLVRYLGSTEMAVLFPLLLANALAPAFDRAGQRFAQPKPTVPDLIPETGGGEGQA